MVDVAEYDCKPCLDDVLEMGGSGKLNLETLRALRVSDTTKRNRGGTK